MASKSTPRRPVSAKRVSPAWLREQAARERAATLDAKEAAGAIQVGAALRLVDLDRTEQIPAAFVPLLP
jgi:hypothetical protein